MRLTKQTKCSNCGAVIKQQVRCEDWKVPPHRCEACGHLQELDLVPDYAWTTWGDFHLAIDRDSLKVLNVVHFPRPHQKWAYTESDGRQACAGSLDEAKAAVENLINGTTGN